MGLQRSYLFKFDLDINVAASFLLCSPHKFLILFIIHVVIYSYIHC